MADSLGLSNEEIDAYVDEAVVVTAVKKAV